MSKLDAKVDGLVINKGEKEDGGRKLRSKDVKNGKKPTLFNFDQVNQLLYRDLPIFVSKATSFNNLYRYSSDPLVPSSKQTQKSTNLTVLDVDDLPYYRKSIDVLTDDKFEIFHRKMKKDEKLMANEDRLRILSEIDNLQTQLTLLNQYDWVRHLPNICHINDLRNYNELLDKKRLTILEIEKLLKKYDNWKRRSDQLANDMKAEDSDIDALKEYDMPFEAIKKNRKLENRKKYGPVIKLHLHNGYLLVIDPIQAPKIIKCDSDRRTENQPRRNRAPSKGKSKVSKHLHHNPAPLKLPPAETVKIARNLRLENVTSIDLMTDLDGDVIFGSSLRDIKVPQDGFQLPKLFKRVANALD